MEYTTSLSEFAKRVMFLREPHFEERRLPHMPESFFGDFNTERANNVLSIVLEYPEYHVVSCIDPDLYVNTFVKNAQSYYLGEGDSNQNLVFDPFEIFDAHFLQSLNSWRNSDCA